ncbi:response regulator [Aquincola sp. MAHUQ-54]|uniref:histidine kinase n=1 Tax=Aquincola agrisoli TaxID=3119538 RepID=A0AAW9Q1E2_9BURK
MTDAHPPAGAIDRSAHEIMVVNDEPASRYATSRLLRSVGFRVREAATGAQALALADQGLSAIVLDVHLPDMDGIEVCRRLRTQYGLARMPVLHLSAAFVTDEDKVKGLDAGADAYLTHPVEPAVIVATVQALVRTRIAENAMRQSEAKFRAIYANAPSGICLIDGDGRFVEVNPAMAQLLGRDPGSLLGQRVSRFAPPDWAGRIDAWLGQPSQALSQGEFPLLDAAGAPVHIDWRLAPLSAEGVRLAMAVDISERLRMERARAHLIEQEQAARGEAERISRMKDELIAVLSHELRSPLNAVMSWAHVLQRRADPELLEKGLEAIKRNCRTQARLLSDILDASRMNAGKLQLELQLVDPQELLLSALEALQPSLQDNDNEVVTELSGPYLPVLVDPARFQQIVWNLLGNATKFSPRGAPIHIGLQQTEHGLRLSIADEGRGIEREFLPFLFDRFSQADARANRSHGGLGLGLSIVKQLVQQHGGSVSAFSEGPGKGSVFHVDLPPAPSAADAGPSASPPEDSTLGDLADAGLVDDTLRGRRVLLVDDDVEACHALALILADRGVLVSTAHSHDEALQALPGCAPDVLVSDLGMPGKTGFDLMRHIRQNEQRDDHLPAVALTAFTRPKDVDEAMAAGFDAHCPKPLRPAELMHVMARLLQRSAPGRA